MRSYEFFRKIYDPIGKFTFNNQTTFVQELVSAAGSTFFCDKYDKNYANRFMLPTVALTLPLKRSYGGKIDKQQLVNFFVQKIPEAKLPDLMESFQIIDPVAPSKIHLAEALAEQFALFITSEEKDVADIVADVYRKNKENTYLETRVNGAMSSVIPVEYRRNPWRYTVVLLDDMPETLDILQDAIDALFADEKRYEVDVYAYTTLMEVIEQCSNSNIDVFVLDVARKAWRSGQVKELDYFGYDLFRLLIYERPNSLVRSKIIFYSRLSRVSIQREFGELSDFSQETRRRNLAKLVEMPEIEYLSKQNASASEVAKSIKDYVDDVYSRENADNEVAVDAT